MALLWRGAGSQGSWSGTRQTACHRAGSNGDGRSPASQREPKGRDAGVAEGGEVPSTAPGATACAPCVPFFPLYDRRGVRRRSLSPGSLPGSGQERIAPVSQREPSNGERRCHACRIERLRGGRKVPVASARCRAMSTRTILAPRWRPGRRAVRWPRLAEAERRAACVAASMRTQGREYGPFFLRLGLAGLVHPRAQPAVADELGRPVKAPDVADLCCGTERWPGPLAPNASATVSISSPRG